MFNKAITFLLSAEKSLNQFNQKTRNEVEKYANRQVKKTAIVCFTVGALVGFGVTKLL